MIIRMACETDFERWLPLWKGYQQFYKADISEKTTAVTWARFLDVTEPMHCAVAEVDKKIVGLVAYARDKHRRHAVVRPYRSPKWVCSVPQASLIRVRVSTFESPTPPKLDLF